MSGPRRMLIVEDDPALLRGLSDAFGDDGFELAVACDGDSAVSMAMDDPPDIVLLDIMLPGFNGFEVCEILRDAYPELPILMVSARGQEADVVRGLELGADDYVTKPFSIAELRARVKVALRRSGGEVAGVVEFGEFVMEAGERRLTRDGVAVELTGQEFELLVYLVSKAGRVVTREMLLRSVWKGKLLGTTRAVDRCVGKLRGKIEADPERPRLVVTVRGVGYRFSEKLKSS